MNDLLRALLRYDLDREVAQDLLALFVLLLPDVDRARCDTPAIRALVAQFRRRSGSDLDGYLARRGIGATMWTKFMQAVSDFVHGEQRTKAEVLFDVRPFLAERSEPAQGQVGAGTTGICALRLSQEVPS